MGSGDGFLFRNPSLRVTVQGGFGQPRGRSDIFDFLTEELTLGRGDFGAGLIGASAAVRVAPRVEAGVSVSYAGRNMASESRSFVGEDDLPIRQTTGLHRVPLMVTARVSLRSQGRSVGRYAWIPTRLVPFLGAGAGPVWYRLRQTGEFVDNETLDIFEDQFESTGWTVGALASGGTDFALTPRVGMTVEGRYSWARGPMNRDFSGFNRIDLSGYDASIGFYFRY